MMFTLTRSIARDRDADLNDQANVKFALTALGYHEDTEEGLSPYSSNQFYDGIKRFQKDKKLKVDGIIKPERETHRAIKDSLKNNSEAFEAYGDFARNYFDMREADFIGGDKYFHCKANYQATSRGWKGKETAEKLSSAREDIQSTFSGEGFKDTVMDHTANWYGRAKAIKGEVKSAREACEYFRPRGLPEKY